MSNTAHFVARDIHLRHTSKDGKSYVQEHRVWDGARFIASEQAAAEMVNADQPAGAPRMANVQQITEEQYRKEKSA